MLIYSHIIAAYFHITNSGICHTCSLFQVCAILWSKEYRELITSHGYALNQLTIWKYPAMSKVAELTGKKTAGIS